MQRLVVQLSVQNKNRHPGDNVCAIATSWLQSPTTVLRQLELKVLIHWHQKLTFRTDFTIVDETIFLELLLYLPEAESAHRLIHFLQDNRRCLHVHFWFSFSSMISSMMTVDGRSCTSLNLECSISNFPYIP